MSAVESTAAPMREQRTTNNEQRTRLPGSNGRQSDADHLSQAPTALERLAHAPTALERFTREPSTLELLTQGASTPEQFTQQPTTLDTVRGTDSPATTRELPADPPSPTEPLSADLHAQAQSDPAGFREALEQAFGDKADSAALDQLADQAARGELPMPARVQFVPAGSMAWKPRFRYSEKLMRMEISPVASCRHHRKMRTI